MANLPERGVHARIAAGWLSKLPMTQNVKPIIVTIKGTEYEGASYESICRYTPGMAAVTDGRKKAGEVYVNQFLYLIGKVPPCYARSTRTCFRLAGDARDYYVAGYMPEKNLNPANVPFHPFGETFMLAPWDVTDGTKIDSHESTPYARVPMKMEPAL